MSRRHRLESPALQYLYDRYIGDDRGQQAAFDQALEDFEVAQAIYDLRTSEGLTQAALAKRVGTTPSVISRLEDADYSGHSLAMLRRIATAMERRVEIRFVLLTEPRKRKRAQPTGPAKQPTAKPSAGRRRAETPRRGK